MKKDDDSATLVDRVVLQAANQFVSYVVTCRRANTREWMEGLADAINAFAEVIGEEDRVATHTDKLQIITPEDVQETL